MDDITKELEKHLVLMGLYPEKVSHPLEHKIRDLLLLIPKEAALAIENYFGLFSQERLSLKEIAKTFKKEDEQMMALIDSWLRRLAISPEWQILKEEIKN